MSNGVIAFILAVGVTGWVYNYFMRRTGGITQNSLIVAGIVGGIVFIVALTVMSLIPS